MKCAVYAATDLVIGAPNEQRFFYPKGSTIQLEVTKDGDVLVIHHALVEVEDKDKNKVEAIVSDTLAFQRMEDLKFLLDAVVFETQLSENIDFKDVSLQDALIVERLTPAHIGRYLNDATSVVEKSYVKDNDRIIRVPVRTIDQVMEAHQKIDLLKTFDPLEAQGDIVALEIRTVSARTAGNANKAHYMVAMDALTGPIEDHVPAYLKAKLEASVPKEWKLRIAEGHRIRIETKGEMPRTVPTFLKTLPVQTELKVVKDGDNTHYEVVLSEVPLRPVVETYYAKDEVYTEYVLEEGQVAKEGESCTTKDGKTGVLQQQGDSLVCIVREAYIPEMDDVIQEGDPVQDEDGRIGTLRKTETGFVAVVPERTVVHYTEGFTTDEDEFEEGDICGKGDQEGTIVRLDSGALACEIAQTVEREIFTVPLPKREAEFGGFSPNPGDTASPRPGDPCNHANRPGTLKLLNGALICSLGEPPAGSDGAN